MPSAYDETMNNMTIATDTNQQNSSPSSTSTLTASTEDGATTVSGNSFDMSGLSSANAALLKEIESLKGEVEAYKTAKPNTPGWRSKNGKRIKLSQLSPEMYQNSYEIAWIIKKILFPMEKFLPKGWEIYSERPRSYCDRFMKRITLAVTMEMDGSLSKKDIWDETVSKIVALKYTMERNQSLQKMRLIFMSKYCLQKFYIGKTKTSNSTLLLHNISVDLQNNNLPSKDLLENWLMKSFTYAEFIEDQNVQKYIDFLFRFTIPMTRNRVVEDILKENRRGRLKDIPDITRINPLAIRALIMGRLRQAIRPLLYSLLLTTMTIGPVN